MVYSQVWRSPRMETPQTIWAACHWGVWPHWEWKTCFLMFRWNSAYFRLCMLPLVLSLCVPEKNLSLSLCSPHQAFIPINKLSLRASLLHSKQSQLSASSHERDVPVPSVSSVFPHSSISVWLWSWGAQSWTSIWTAPETILAELTRREGSLPLACWWHRIVQLRVWLGFAARACYWALLNFSPGPISWLAPSV